jgi:hypothetical protein
MTSTIDSAEITQEMAKRVTHLTGLPTREKKREVWVSLSTEIEYLFVDKS